MMRMEKRYYLAYGSNLNKNQMRYRCPDAKAVGVASLIGWRLLFKGSLTGAYLTIEEHAGSSVPVAIWEVSPGDERHLDRYEGYPTFYHKKEMDVLMKSTGKTVHAFVYIMHEDRKAGCPTESYINTCAVGYRDFGFDIMKLDKALRDSVKLSRI
jgi:gamma-glutamylcyclotransferase (GGCT)/AIG2-like uncharacterized protein YtfP